MLSTVPLSYQFQDYIRPGQSYQEIPDSFKNFVISALFFFVAHLCMRYSPPLFLAGCVVGLIFSEEIKEVVEKVKKLVLQNFFTLYATFHLGMLVLPHTLHLLTFSAGALMVSWLTSMYPLEPDDTF